MRLQNLAACASSILFICMFAFGQTQPSETDSEKDKKKKEIDERVVQMLDQTINEGDGLLLPQNRALVYGISGDLYWKFDAKRSRELFRKAGFEIIAYNQENEKEKEKREIADAFSDVFGSGAEARNEILLLVAKRDAELALELLLMTRPTKLADAILRASQPNAKSSGGGMFSFDFDRQRVSQELALEQQFAMLVADENPEKAIKLIKDSLSKGVSTNVLPLLQKLNKKDEKMAAELAGEVIKKLVDSDLAKNDENMSAAINFLQFAFKPPPASTQTKDKEFSFSDTQVKDLANKVANALLQPSKTMATAMMLNQAMPMLEKFVPDKVLLLKQRQTEISANMPSEFQRMQDQMKLFNPNSTPEDIIAQLPKLNEVEKILANQSLIAKIGQIEDEARAKKLIDQISDQKTRTTALEQFEAARIGRTASAGKLDEARNLIGNLTKKGTQIQRLVSLATDFYQKGGEKDIDNSKSLMKDARALTNEFAESSEDLADFMEVVKGYTIVEPDIAFGMFERVIEQINNYIHASAVIAKYNTRNSGFVHGELSFKGQGNSRNMPLFRFEFEIQQLGKADFERMSMLADKLHRTDSRTMVKLWTLQGTLSDGKNQNRSNATGGVNIIF